MFRMELSLAEPNAFWNKNAVLCHTTVVGVNHLGFNTKHEVEPVVKQYTGFVLFQNFDFMHDVPLKSIGKPIRFISTLLKNEKSTRTH